MSLILRRITGLSLIPLLPLLPLLSLIMTGALYAQSTPSLAQALPSIWDGIYTQEQAGRGQAVYQAACVACHSADLRGNSNAPSLLGMSFMFLWEGRSVGELFTNIRTQMPSENPNSLPAQSYLDVLAFILQANSFPAGTSELTTDLDQLNAIGIVAEPAQQ